MEKVIQEKLLDTERKFGVHILFACEAGSRATGLASSSSDYDVRFLYVRPLEGYLKLEDVRDVIEYPVGDNLDVNGWDLQKALRLLYRSNPGLFEWFASPVVYRDSDAASHLRSLLPAYFSPEKSLRHYLSMASNCCRAYLTDDTVTAKKYLYILRPVLACRWILENGTQPPLQITELTESELPGELSHDAAELIALKTVAPKSTQVPRMEAMDSFLYSEIERLQVQLKGYREERRSEWEPLNQFFLSALDSESRNIK